MSDILISLLTLLGLTAGLTALVSFVRHDTFAAPGMGYQPRDELGPLAFRRRPA